jgi:hypothetical protein
MTSTLTTPNQIRPGIFQITTPAFVATVDAGMRVPQVEVRYLNRTLDWCNPVYTRDHDFRGTGITLTVVNANPGHMAAPGERAIVDALLDTAEAHLKTGARSQWRRCPMCGNHANIIVGVCGVCDGE